MITSEFASHNIFEKLNLLEGRVHSPEIAEKIDLETVDFLKASCSYIRSQIDKSLTVLINGAELTAISTELENSLNQINEFIGDNNAGHITNATNYLYSAISRAKGFPIPTEGNFSFSALVNDFKLLVEQKTKEISKSISEINSSLDSIGGSIKAKETELDKISKTIIEKQTLVDALSGGFQTSFDQIKSVESTKFEDLRLRLQTSIDQKVKDIDEATKLLIDRLAVKEGEAKKLVNVIGNIGASGNYQQIADSHKKAANVWRWVAVGFMSILSGILITTIWLASVDTFNWQLVLLRILSALVLSYPATYASRESSKHRKLENINRKAELELASINPFIENLDDQKKQVIKEKLAEKYFGNKDVSEDKSDGKSDDEVPLGVLERIVKLVNELKK